jgi:hypothetical protein
MGVIICGTKGSSCVGLESLLQEKALNNIIVKNRCFIIF